MMEVQKYLRNHTLDDLEKNFSIKIRKYDDRVILNYDQLNSPKYHPIVVECRALILSLPDFKVLSRSFDRFFNYGEGETSKNFRIDYALEKIDGSLVSIYHDGKNWCIATRSMAFAEGLSICGNSYACIVLRALKLNNMSELDEMFEYFDKSYTYVFELVSRETRIVTPYEYDMLFALTCRNKETGCEDHVNYFELIEELQAAKLPGWTYVKTPKVYSFKSFVDAFEILKNYNAMDEGLVCCSFDEDICMVNRVKVKNPAYLAIAHMKNNGVISLKRIAYLIFSNDYEEYLSYFPEEKIHFEPLIKAHKKLINDIKSKWNETYCMESQKEYALKVNALPFSSIMFLLRRGKKLEDILVNLKEDVMLSLLEKYKEKS